MLLDNNGPSVILDPMDDNPLGPTKDNIETGN